MSAASVLLRTVELSKSFAGVHALRGVSFELAAGEVHALCGENGAGKSTLIKLLSGVHPHGSYQGTIELEGKPCRFRSTRDAERAGIAVIHQELPLLSSLTIGENLSLHALPLRHGLIDWSAVRERARATLRACEVELDPDTPVSELGVGQRQLVEIARAVGKHPRVLVLDEPTAALSDREADRLLALIAQLRARGVSCIYVSHKLDEVFRIADRITVLRDGASVATAPARETSAGEVIRHMVGRELSAPRARTRRADGEPLLQVNDLSVANVRRGPVRLRGVSLSVRAGEVLGIGGLLGAGRSELLLHLMGVYGTRLRGEVRLCGRQLAPGDPRAALRAGLALVSEDRRRHGLFADANVVFNVSLASLGQRKLGPLIDRAAEWRATRDALLRVGQPSVREVAAGALSGGNQQKLVLARALLCEPRVLLLDEPTRGIDVGAKREVHDVIAALSDAGTAIVLVSSELDELLALSDRIAMLCAGAIAGEFARADATPERLLSAALGRTHQTAEAG